MSQFKAMKFRTYGEKALSEIIQKLLFEKGYGWVTGGKNLQHTTAKYLYTEEDGSLLFGTDDNRFDSNEEQEYHVFNMQIIPKIEDEPVHDFGIDGAVNSDKIYIGTFSAHPVGLRSRQQATQERLVEVLEAMVRYAKAGEKIPVEWQDELSDMFYEASQED